VCPLKSIVDLAGIFKEFKVKSSNNVILSPGWRAFNASSVVSYAILLI
jgi:hypothetical protein